MPFATSSASAPPAPIRSGSLTALRSAAAVCRECPLGAHATQTVWGEGPARCPLMLVGEQPGDQEDRIGQPFVGPAGRLLRTAMQELGWPANAAYVTNAVKHFKFEWRGKRRMHKTPGQLEMLACRHWLESEIATVRPRAIVALGGVAARALLGRKIAVMAERGHWLDRGDGRPVLITVHPASLLRRGREDFEALRDAWLEELALASEYVKKVPA